jgi:hypothetical protein
MPGCRCPESRRGPSVGPTEPTPVSRTECARLETGGSCESSSNAKRYQLCHPKPALLMPPHLDIAVLISGKINARFCVLWNASLNAAVGRNSSFCQTVFLHRESTVLRTRRVVSADDVPSFVMPWADSLLPENLDRPAAQTTQHSVRHNQRPLRRSWTNRTLDRCGVSPSPH